MKNVHLLPGLPARTARTWRSYYWPRGSQIRRASTFNTARMDHLSLDPHSADASLFLYFGNLSHGTRSVTRLAEVAPHEVYNPAAHSHVRVS